MATPERLPPTPHIPWILRRPGYWQTRRILARIRRFRDLAIDCDRWASLLVPPSQKPIGPTRKPITAVEQQLNKLVLSVARDMDMVGVRHGMTVSVGGVGKPDGKVQYDLLADFTIFPENYHQQRLEVLMHRLEMVIGAYEERKQNAIRDWFNPLFWLAAVIRIPVSILEFAGLISTYEEHSALIKFYGWAVRIAFLSVLVFLAAFLAQKAGISPPWVLLGHHFK
jgi:hypothetical protein